uniref:Uncharacterized protein n=1 Tax=viral metagenome TaxID=1070528 RepID=A0A6C0JKD8_9ZZZZ
MSKKVMQCVFWMIFLVFTAFQSQTHFLDPLFRNYFQKNKNGHLFLSIFENRPDFFPEFFWGSLHIFMLNM